MAETAHVDKLEDENIEQLSVRRGHQQLPWLRWPTDKEEESQKSKVSQTPRTPPLTDDQETEVESKSRRANRQQILDRINREFDLKTALANLRKKNAVIIKINNNRSNDRLINSGNLQKRLQQFTGANEIRLNDFNFMKSLVRRIDQHKQEANVKNEQTLVEKEVRRERKLQLARCTDTKRNKEEVLKNCELRKCEKSDFKEHRWPKNPHKYSVSDTRIVTQDKNELISDSAKIMHADTIVVNNHELQNDANQFADENDKLSDECSEELENLEQQNLSQLITKIRPNSPRVEALQKEEDLRQLYQLAEKMVFLNTCQTTNMEKYHTKK